MIHPIQIHYKSIIGISGYFFNGRFPETAMISKLDDYLRFNETSLNLRAQRQQLLASNIANADTPNYKARDIDFNKALQGAMARTGTAGPEDLTKTAAAHLSGSAATSVGAASLLYRGTQQGNIDGNTVEMDVERNQFADNALRYEAGLTLVSAQIKSMLTAIQG
jgi:flagellar basal-body rod protein FlgB